jgi:ferredoxin
VKYRIVVDLGLCQGHGVCQAEAPQLFRMVDRSQAYPQSEVIGAEPPPELLAKAEDAVELCPNSAIRVVHLED